MESGFLPRSVDPERAADQRLVFTGPLDAAALERLKELAAGDSSRVSGRLAFVRDEQGRAVMEGHAEASLPLLCQRCAAVFQLEFHTDWRRIFARSEADERDLAEKGADVCYHVGLLDVADVVEEELMLALPMAPRHPEGCEPILRPATGTHPFAGLAGLLKRDRRDNRN
ncbi:YceD family protein [Acidiferrobacter sp.]|uniref:YceD family protein n=1 Tax=Acidiferrobacter sp. TaxID=1872107 RepID=UPI002613C3C5|nr:YceD family protein [Acidiferrobacter sp.]